MSLRLLHAAIAAVVVVGLVAVGGAPAGAAPLAADVYVVAAGGSDDGPCTVARPCATLPAALAKVASRGVVHLAAGTYFGTTTVPSGLTVTIQGAGAATTVLNGLWAGTVLTVPAGAVPRTVKLVDVTVFGGSATARTGYAGGGIMNFSGLIVLRSRIHGNGAQIGGGIDNAGSLDVIDTEIDGNQATGDGGGGIHSTSFVSITGSTVANNTASPSGSGAGLLLDSADITNSTIHHNINAGFGGGIASSGYLWLNRVTVTANAATSAGGVRAPSFTITASVVADNQGGDCKVNHVVHDSEYVVDTDGLCAGTDHHTTVPWLELGDLGDNGGPTPTVALPYASPARNLIPMDSWLCNGTDQRGRPRRVTIDGCDAGAVQWTPHLSVSTTRLDFGLHTAGDKATATVTVTNTATAPVPIAALSTTTGYDVADTDCDGATLPAGGTCRVDVVFEASIGSSPGRLSIDYDDLSERPTVAVALAGAGTEVPVNLSPPALTGDASTGTTLSVDPGQWAGVQPMKFTVQWWRCTTDGNGCELVGTEPTYTVSIDDLRWSIRAAVTASNSAGWQEAHSNLSVVRR